MWLRPMTPEELEGAKLPRAKVGGYSPGPTEELLQAAAWQLRQFQHDQKQLLEKNAQLEEELQQLRTALSAREAELATKGQREEAISATLATAQRAARGIREATRQECEATIKKARRRAEMVSRKATSDRAQLESEIRKLEVTYQSARDQLRVFLESALAQLAQPALSRTVVLEEELRERLPQSSSPPDQPISAGDSQTAQH